MNIPICAIKYCPLLLHKSKPKKKNNERVRKGDDSLKEQSSTQKKKKINCFSFLNYVYLNISRKKTKKYIYTYICIRTLFRRQGSKKNVQNKKERDRIGAGGWNGGLAGGMRRKEKEPDKGRCDEWKK